jgi:glycosyltransferase involved in cell wall biosynthesis
VTRRLRIGIDAHAIGERKTGNERFISNLIPALRGLCDHELVLYFTRPEAAAEWGQASRQEVHVLKPGHPLARIPFALPYRARRDRLDVLLVQYTGPPIVGCPIVTVVHDVAYALYPRYYSATERLWMRRTIPYTMRRAAAVVTVSEFSKREIVRVHGISPGRVTVAHNGVDPIFRDPSQHPSPVDPPFFLTVGNLQPRKNLPMLVRAFRRLVREHPEVAERLVIVGQEWFGAESFHRETEDLRSAGRLVFTGYVPDEQVVGLLRRATAFAYPSVYEGFGLPPVEAMAAGAPTLVGDIPVMREVVGENCLRIPPKDESAWAAALARIAGDASLRADLAERGRSGSARFTWEGSARSVLGALEGAADGTRPSIRAP